MIGLWENRSEAAQWWNTERPLTHPLDLGEEGIAMQATRICAVAECDRPHRSHGFCARHSARFLRHGDPLGGRRSPIGGECIVEECARPYRANGMCSAHLQRMKRTGSLRTTRFDQRSCAVEGCDRRSRSRGWCSLHYERWRANGHPEVVRPNPAMLPGDRNCKWKGVEVGYGTAHDRVRAAYGPAADKPCVDCDRTAEGWSYDHLDPDERIDPSDPKRMPYSTKIEHYQPRCNACHWKLDHPTGKPTRT